MMEQDPSGLWALGARPFSFIQNIVSDAHSGSGYLLCTRITRVLMTPRKQNI